MEFWIRVAQLLLSLSILIVLHEFGHFIPARLFKTRVEKFYLFFDPWFSLVKKKIGQTEWGIGWLPLGGYVKISGMVDESMDKEQLAQPAQPWEFRSKPAWQRLIIMLGGVTVNVIVGFLIYIMVLAVWGEEKVHNDKVHHGLAVHPYLEQYGFKSGDKILEIEGQKNELRPEKVGGEILIFDKRNFKVEHADGKIESIHLPENIGTKLWENDVENSAFGLRYFIERIDSVPAKGAAKRVGIKPGDKILAVNGQEVTYHDEFTKALYLNKGKKIKLLIDRKGKEIEKDVFIGKKAQLGVFFKDMKSPDQNEKVVYNQDYSVGEAFTSGFGKGWKTIYGNIAQFKYVFTKKGAGSVGGFGAIGKLFPASWNWEAFWMLTAFLSFMLAVMNLLPIPALDGGHVMFLLYEMIAGKPASQNVMEKAQYVGFFLLIGLLLYANGNDLIKAIFG